MGELWENFYPWAKRISAASFDHRESGLPVRSLGAMSIDQKMASGDYIKNQIRISMLFADQRIAFLRLIGGSCFFMLITLP